MRDRKSLSSVLILLLVTSILFISVTDAFTGPLIWSGEILLTVDPTFTYEDDNGKNITLYFTPCDEFASIISAHDGKVWVAWQSEFPPENPDRFEILYKVYDGDWTDATQLTNNPGRNNRTPALLQTANGTIWVFWVSDRTGNNEIFYKTTSNNGGLWSSEAQVTDDTRRDGNPAVAQTNDGKIWLVWSRQINSTTEQIYYKTFNGTTWSSENQLTTSVNIISQLPSIIQAKDGKIWILWSRNMTTMYHIVYRMFNGTAWSSEIQLTNDDRYNVDPGAFVERDGTIWVVWASETAQMHATFDIYYKTSADNGTTWSSSVQFTTNAAEDWQPAATQTRDKGIWVIWTSTRDDPNSNPNQDLYSRITALGDIDHSGVIDITDLDKISKALATDPYNWPPGTGWNQWNAECDLNVDNRVNILDMTIAAVNFGVSA